MRIIIRKAERIYFIHLQTVNSVMQELSIFCSYAKSNIAGLWFGLVHDSATVKKIKLK